MSDQTTAQAEPTVSESTDSGSVSTATQVATNGNVSSEVNDNGERVELTDIERIFFNELSARIEKRNEDVATLVAIGGDSQALLESLRKSSDDPVAVEIRGKLEKLIAAEEELRAKMDAVLKPQVEKIRNDSKGKIEELETAISKADKEIKGTFPLLQSYPNVLKVLPKLTHRNAGQTRATSDKPDGRRIRGWQVSVNGSLATIPSKDGKTLSNLAAAATKIAKPEITTQVLQDAFFAVVGVETKPDAMPGEVDFTVNAADGTAYQIHMVKAEKQSDK